MGSRCGLADALSVQAPRSRERSHPAVAAAGPRREARFIPGGGRAFVGHFRQLLIDDAGSGRPPLEIARRHLPGKLIGPKTRSSVFQALYLSAGSMV